MFQFVQQNWQLIRTHFFFVDPYFESGLFQPFVDLFYGWFGRPAVTDEDIVLIVLAYIAREFNHKNVINYTMQ